MKKDSIGHYLSPSGIRFALADATAAARTAAEAHHLSPLGGTILGKVMLSAALLAADFKNHEGVSIKWSTNTALGSIHCDAYEGGFVRGFLDYPEAVQGKAYSEDEEREYIGSHGNLFVTRYSLLKRPYVSSVDLESGSISDCIDKYFQESDQTLSHMEIQVSFCPDGTIRRLSGFMAQLLPEGDKELFDKLFSPSNRYDLYSEDTENPFSLQSLMNSADFFLCAEYPLAFRCTCGEERIKSSLMGLPAAEKESLLADEYIEINCHYCGKKYRIRRETLKKWFAEKTGGNKYE